MLLLAMLLILGVLGCDFSRAFSVQARLQTAADAATLATCNEAEIKGLALKRDVGFQQQPNRRSRSSRQDRFKVGREKWVDLSGREIQANTAARAAFAKESFWRKCSNGRRSRTAGAGHIRSKIFTSPAYAYSSGIAYDQPKTAPDGSTYYDTYKVSSAEAG